MRAASIAATLLVTACSLVAPFDLEGLRLRGGSDGDAEADGDAGADGETAPDSDADLPGDADPGTDAEPEADAWSPLGGCAGAGESEQWLVVAQVGGELHTYVTGRDCAEPELLCEGCYGAGFSPSGDGVLVLIPQSSWRLQDEIGYVDLGEAPWSVRWLGVAGTNPVFVDEDTFVYIAAAAGENAPCAPDPGVPPERTDLRRRAIDTGDDVVLGSPLFRAWRGGFPVPDPDGHLVALGHDVSPYCSEIEVLVSIRNTDTGFYEPVYFPGIPGEIFPVGLLPDGSGFLMQLSAYWEYGRLYASSWDGDVVPVYPGRIDAVHRERLVGSLVSGWWPSCGSVRRLGSACELYCLSVDGSTWWRMTVAGDEPVAIDCTISGADAQISIMDVWQDPVD